MVYFDRIALHHARYLDYPRHLYWNNCFGHDLKLLILQIDSLIHLIDNNSPPEPSAGFLVLPAFSPGYKGPWFGESDLDHCCPSIHNKESH